MLTEINHYQRWKIVCSHSSALHFVYPVRCNIFYRRNEWTISEEMATDTELNEVLRSKRICRFCLTQDEPLSNLYSNENRKNCRAPLPLQIMACVSIEVCEFKSLLFYCQLILINVCLSVLIVITKQIVRFGYVVVDSVNEWHFLCVTLIIQWIVDLSVLKALG